jgi:hypothetical protein
MPGELASPTTPRPGPWQRRLPRAAPEARRSCRRPAPMYRRSRPAVPSRTRPGHTSPTTPGRYVCTQDAPLSQTALLPPRPLLFTSTGERRSDNTQTRTACISITVERVPDETPAVAACGSCHSIPPSTGKHTYHVSSRGIPCSTCHGTGYSSTTVNAATHLNGTTNLVSSLNFNATTSSCSPACHGTKTW